MARYFCFEAVKDGFAFILGETAQTPLLGQAAQLRDLDLTQLFSFPGRRNLSCTTSLALL
jgi:hypothetical protein